MDPGRPAAHRRRGAAPPAVSAGAWSLHLTAEGQRLARRAIAALEEADARFFGAEAAALTALRQRMIGPGLHRDRATAPAVGAQDSSP